MRSRTSSATTSPRPPSPRSASASARSISVAQIGLATAPAAAPPWRATGARRSPRTTGSRWWRRSSATVPASTCGSSASCCALLKRWISSTNSTVRSPCWSRRVAASATASRRSLTPAMHRGERARTARAPRAASRRASVVFPVPGGPHRMSDGSSARLERAPQQLARPQQVRLPDELVQRARPHPLGQRLPAPILASPPARTGPWRQSTT